MKKNKPKDVKALIFSKFIMYIAVFAFILTIQINLSEYFLYKKISAISIPSKVDIDNIDVNNVHSSEDYLARKLSQVIIADKANNIIDSCGEPIVAKGSANNIIKRFNKNLGYVVSSKKIESGKFLGCTLYLITDVIDEYEVETTRIYKSFSFANMIIIIFTFILTLILFIRSVSKPIINNFKIIQEYVKKNNNKFNYINTDDLNLKECLELAKTYNAMVNILKKEELEKEIVLQNSNTLISNLAHDLKSPLTVLKGYAEILANEDGLNERYKKYLGYIFKSTLDLCNLVNLLFEQIRYGNDELKLNFELSDINNILRETCANYYIFFEKKGFVFTSDISEQACFVRLDVLSIKRVFSNLLQNTLNHNAIPTIVNVQSYVSDNKLFIFFKDNGIGIDDKNKDRIFEPFFQEDLSRNTGSAGLGLYAVKQILQKHNASIHVSSDDKYKTVFTIIFEL